MADTGQTSVERHERLQILFDTSPDAIILHDEAGSIVDVNAQTVENLGYAHEELRSMNVAEIAVGYDREEFQDLWVGMDTGDRKKIDVRHRRQDGTTFPVEVSVRKIELDGEERFITLSRDVTERREIEQRLKEQRDNLDILNQVLRHDIRNDLQLVTAYTELLSDRVGEDDQAQEYVASVLESANHAVELTKTAREIAEVMVTTADNQQRVDLRNVLENELDQVRSSHSGALVTVEESIPEVSVIANDMLASVFRNLMKNAIQHNDKDVPQVAVSATVEDGSVVVSIADNGPGIPDAQKENVFGRGEKGLDSPGTGLGLYLVRTLVDIYGGEVWVEDNDPEGTVAVVELPTAE
ncbi:MAG: PAS domain S-box protein [Salinirussus sp.]